MARQPRQLPRVCILSAALLTLALTPAAHCSEKKKAPDKWDAAVVGLKRELGDSFIVEKCRPFVIAGKITPDQFRRYRRFTVAQCRDALWKDFFEKRPDCVIRVYLFHGKEDYHKYTRQLFAEKPISPYGYYVPADERLVMDISTGGGTLVHEMTHALMRPDFPDVPKWFDEGLASLFEQCEIRNGSLRGLVNWRLPRLQKAVRENALLPLTRLVATTREEFCGPNEDLHYAEARYLCMYMQEKRILRKFYKLFRDTHKSDPTGAKALRKLFRKPLDQVQKEWVKWVKTLKWK